MNDGYTMKDIYSGTYQSNKGYEGEFEFNEVGKANNIPLTWLHNKNGYVHQDNLRGVDFYLMDSIPIDVKWSGSISNDNTVRIEFLKERRDYFDPDWRFLHNGIMDENYKAFFIAYGDYQTRLFYMINVPKLRDFINSLSEETLEKAKLDYHYVQDINGWSRVRSYAFPATALVQRGIITSLVNIK